MKQKIISVIIVAAVVFSFIGCGAASIFPSGGFSSPEALAEAIAKAVIDGKSEKLVGYMSPKLIKAIAEETGSSEKEVRADLVSSYEKLHSDYEKWFNISLPRNPGVSENPTYEIYASYAPINNMMPTMIELYGKNYKNDPSISGADSISIYISKAQFDGFYNYNFVILLANYGNSWYLVDVHNALPPMFESLE